MKKFPMKFLAYWGILAVKFENKNIKKSVRKRALTYKDWHEMLPSYFKCTLRQGQPPLLPSVHNMEVVLPVEVKVSPIGVMLKSKLELKCMTTLYNYIKKGWIKFPTRRFVPVISRNLVLKKTLSFLPNSRGKWTPNYEGACAMTPVTTNVDKPACRCSQEILCQK